jgi:hypothetical protein
LAQQLLSNRYTTEREIRAIFLAFLGIFFDTPQQRINTEAGTSQAQNVNS